MVSAASTPAMVAWTPLASTSSHSSANPARNGHKLPHPEPAQRRHPPGQHQRRRQRHDIEVGGVGDRDDQHRANVVDHRDGHQQQLDRRRHARAEQRQQPQREGDVGRRRDRPAAAQPGLESDDQQIDQRRHRHPAGRGDDWQPAVAGARQPSLIPFALHLQPDQQEEDRHQPVGDQQMRGQHAGARQTHAQRKLEQMVPARRQRADWPATSASAAIAISSSPAARSLPRTCSSATPIRQRLEGGFAQRTRNGLEARAGSRSKGVVNESFLVIDEGTSSTRAMQIGADGRLGVMAQRELTTSYPAARLGRAGCRRDLGADPVRGARGAWGRGEAAAIGITNQRETIVFWDRASGRALAPAIVWQDRRTAARLRAAPRRRP